jgi:tetratricopeptide (TPR) repeat protein
VSGPLFEQYKAALRRGHTSTLAGRLDDALEAYGEAARLVPERALPLASQGTVLHRLDRWPEAAEVFETALQRVPDDEATLRARATAREERGMRSGAAADFEGLAFVLDVAGRAPEAAEAARRANELETNPARAALAERLGAAADRATDPGSADVPVDAATELADMAEAGVDAEGLPVATDLDVPAPPRIVPVTAAEAARAARTEDPSESWPLVDQPSPPPPPIVGPPPDTEALMSEAAALFEGGDTGGASEKMLTAAAVHRAAGRLDAALDVCFQLLAITPGDPHVHLAIANLQLDRGWTPLAREKIDLLVRLTSLTGDTRAEADVHGLAAERLRDEPVGAGRGR